MLQLTLICMLTDDVIVIVVSGEWQVASGKWKLASEE